MGLEAPANVSWAIHLFLPNADSVTNRLCPVTLDALALTKAVLDPLRFLWYTSLGDRGRHGPMPSQNAEGRMVTRLT
jgi:hypothetical protein